MRVARSSGSASLGASGTDTPLPLLARLTYGQAWRSQGLLAEFAAFRSWTERYLGAPVSERTALEPEGASLAAARRSLMLGLIEEDSELALAATMPASVRSAMPASVLSEIESRVSGTGKLAQLCYLPPEGTGSPTIEHKVLLDGKLYTAVARSSDDGAGIALVEVYELPAENAQSQRLVNISTRGQVEAGDRALIAGFVVTGNARKRVLLRAVGPALAGFGVSGALSDPQLQVYDAGHATIASNDDWSDAADPSATRTVSA